MEVGVGVGKYYNKTNILPRAHFCHVCVSVLTASLSRLPDIINPTMHTHLWPLTWVGEYTSPHLLPCRGSPDEVAEWPERSSPALGDWGTQNSGVWTPVKSNQWLDTCSLLARHSAFVGWGKAQFQDNVTECDIRSMVLTACFSCGQHYKVTMSMRCHKSIPVLIWS